MSTIFITEKPSVAQEYRKVLQVQQQGKTDGYVEGFSPVMKTNVIITWAVGHLIEICKPEEQNKAWAGRWNKENLPMIPQAFKYKPQENTAEQFRIVKSLYTRKDIDCIYYAGDSGREGIYIQALIRNQIFKTAPKFSEKVVWIDSFTEQAILDGIKTAKPYTAYQPMIDSGYARAISDWLIGMNFTESFTLTSGTLINVGRVMTPTLAMVVNRQEEIDKFVKTDYYGVKADKFASWKAVEGSRYHETPLLYNETGFKKKEDADALASNCNTDPKLTVEQVKVQKKTEYAPYLFNLADLQAYCSKRFKISPAKTLEYAQSLYEKKFTTYPRTDCRFLSTAVASDLKAKGYTIPKRYVDDSKVTDHYAIIPTLQGNASTLTGTEKQVYDAIKKRFDDTMKPPFIYDAVSVTYLHRNGERFFESYRIIKQMGFKDNNMDNEENAEEIYLKTTIPNKGDIISVNAFTTYNMETRPPSSYTTGSLILAMEKAGKLTAEKLYRYFLDNPPQGKQLMEMRSAFYADDHRIWYLSETEKALLLGQPISLTASGDQTGGENTGTGGTPLSMSSAEARWAEISERMQMDMETFSKQQGDRAGNLMQNLREVNREKYDYTSFLKKFAVRGEVMRVDDDAFDYIFYTYGLKLYRKMPLVEPLEYKEVKRIREFVIAIDTSGSVSGELVQAFVQKTYNVLKSTESFFSKINLHIIQCDATIQSDVKITDKEEFKEYMRNVEFHGFGGTDFRPVFEYVNEMIDHHEFDDLRGLIYFTDGYGTYPSRPANYKTAFVFSEDYDDSCVPSWIMKYHMKEDFS